MKNQFKNIITAVLAFTVAVSAAACTGADTSTVSSETASEAAAAVIKVGANITPHAEILEQAKPILAEKGITLEIVQLEDSVTPNTGVIEGSLDANYFQHVPYLEQFNSENGSDLVSIGAIHYEPFGIYAGKTNDLSKLEDGAVVAVPNNVTNEARALLLLDDLGYIKLDPNAGIAATPADITDNPKNISFKEVEAAQVPNVLQDVDYAIINSNYAIEAGINPVKDSLGIEGSASAYGNVLVVKEGSENEPKILALKAALESQQVVDFINEKYDGAVVSVVENPTDGYSADIDYGKLKGETITVAASPTPHAEILAVVADILKEKDITVDIKEYTDYVQPNNVVDSGEIDANYFQHIPYLDDFNAENGTKLVSVSTIHVEPLGLYGGKQSTTDALK